MEQPDALPLVFMAHFQQARLEEVEMLVKYTDGPELRSVAENYCNPKVRAEIERLEAQHVELQAKYYGRLRELVGEERWDAYARQLELWENQDEITRYNACKAELEYLKAMTADLKAQNKRISDKIELEKQKLLARKK